jgi:hypothetical protein
MTGAVGVTGGATGTPGTSGFAEGGSPGGTKEGGAEIVPGKGGIIDGGGGIFPGGGRTCAEDTMAPIARPKRTDKSKEILKVIILL